MKTAAYRMNTGQGKSIRFIAHLTRMPSHMPSKVYTVWTQRSKLQIPKQGAPRKVLYRKMSSPGRMDHG